MDDKQKADAFLKDIDAVCEKHNLLLGISNPQFVVQPKHGNAPQENKVDLERLPVEELGKMVDKYVAAADKAQTNIAIIRAEIAKRVPTQTL